MVCENFYKIRIGRKKCIQCNTETGTGENNFILLKTQGKLLAINNRYHRQVGSPIDTMPRSKNLAIEWMHRNTCRTHNNSQYENWINLCTISFSIKSTASAECVIRYKHTIDWHYHRIVCLIMKFQLVSFKKWTFNVNWKSYLVTLLGVIWLGSYSGLTASGLRWASVLWGRNLYLFKESIR